MPHAIQIRQAGGPEVLNWTPIEVGEPGSGQVRLRQAAVGLNYIDVYHRTGYYSQPLPFIPGLEGAGTVEAIGQDVRRLKVGDRVAYAGPAGGYSEVRLIEALVRLPDAISFDQSAVMMLKGMTAQVLSADRSAKTRPLARWSRGVLRPRQSASSRISRRFSRRPARVSITLRAPACFSRT